MFSDAIDLVVGLVNKTQKPIYLKNIHSLYLEPFEHSELWTRGKITNKKEEVLSYFFLSLYKQGS